MRVGVVARALVLGCGFFAAVGRGEAFGGFQLVSQSHTVDADRRETTFMLEFSEPPDFRRTVANMPGGTKVEANSFQVFYGSDLTGPDVLGEDVVVLRGPEIRFDGDLPVRDTIGAVDDPRAGGFGTVRGSVPLELVDDTVTFTVPWHLLGERDQAYRFTIEAYERGELTSSVSIAAPLPAGAWPALTMLGAMLTRGAIRKRLRGGASV
jgi:hypothetical protein